jgi:GWxTD domain-containing protein
LGIAPDLPAQGGPSQTPQEPPPITEGLPKRELTEKERKKREKKLREELESYFRKWLEEDVGYIIAPEEASAFLDLGTDEEREQFIEQFWLRRDPTPHTIENEYKDEHYRRIAYANEWFGGWRSDRGRVYILHGPPDDTEFYPAGSTYERPLEEGAGSMTTYAFERWRYRNLPGIGSEIFLEFVDVNGIGDYRLSMDANEKDAFLSLLPGLDPILMRQLGLANPGDRFSGQEGATEYLTQRAQMQRLDRLRLYTAVQKPPPVKFKDLEELVTTRISFNLLPYRLRIDFFRITDETILVPLTVSLRRKDLSYQLKDGLHHCEINVFGRVSTLTGRIVQTFEDVIQLDVHPSMLEKTMGQSAVYQKALPLRPGLYKLNLVLKDLNSGNLGTTEQRLAVPRFEEGRLAHSSLILADRIERAAARKAGTGQFVIGDTKLRPRVGEEFRSSDRMGVYVQVYNLGLDEDTQMPRATIEYSVRQGDQVFLSHTETTAELPRAGSQLTLEKSVPLEELKPGQYELRIAVIDHIRQVTVNPGADFHVVR